MHVLLNCSHWFPYPCSQNPGLPCFQEYVNSKLYIMCQMGADINDKRTALVHNLGVIGSCVWYSEPKFWADGRRKSRAVTCLLWLRWRSLSSSNSVQGLGVNAWTNVNSVVLRKQISDCKRIKASESSKHYSPIQTMLMRTKGKLIVLVECGREGKQESQQSMWLLIALQI
jgi:hypothetical protein